MSKDPKPPPSHDGDGREELLKLTVLAAHQLKSPLAAIQSSLSLVLGGFFGPITARQREILETTTRSASRGTDLVTDLLRLRSLDGIQQPDLVPVDFASMGRSTLDRFKSTAATKELSLTGHLDIPDPGQAWVLGDPVVLGEIIHVLVDNAIKYTPRGGEVTGRISLLPAGHKPLANRDALAVPHYLLEVIDTGIGIPPEAWSQLYTEFYRAPNARGLSREGTGLGLAFALRATRILGGILQLEPASTGGVRAVLALPMLDEAERDRLHGSHPMAQEVRTISRRVVVIGGVTAGAKAAARIMRLDPDADVTIVERDKFLSYAGCGLPYYIAGVVRDQLALLSSPLGDRRDSSFFHNLKNVRAMDLTEVLSIDRTTKTVVARNRASGKEINLPYDQLVLATGSTSIMEGAEGQRLEGIYSLKSVANAEAIRSQLRAAGARDVVIVGGGILGCQITEAVATRGGRISLVEQGPEILSTMDPQMAALVRRHMESRGVRVCLGSTVLRWEGEGRIQTVWLSDGRRLPADFVILATGVRPRVELAVAAGLKLGPTGAIQVDPHLRTSDPDIYAVGDCAETQHIITGKPTWIPMGSTATKQGRVAADNICGGDERFPGVVGAKIFRVFDYNVGRTGLSEEEAHAAGMDPICALVSGPDADHYLPSARNITLLMVADRKTGVLLGLQGLGPGEVAKRLDVVSTALATGMTLRDLSLLDLAYAPPYSQAMDLVLTAANVIRNKIAGRFTGIRAHALKVLLESDAPPVLIDVRLPAEYAEHRFGESLHVPLGTLRGRLHEVPRDRAIVTVGKAGLRGYEAALILSHAGFPDVRVLDGGLDAWPYDLEQM